jgi:hypothetical protein
MPYVPAPTPLAPCMFWHLHHRLMAVPE